MKLVYYHPIAIKDKHPYQKTINPCISVLDRTKNTWPKYDYIKMFPMPQLESKREDFIQISTERINEIVNENKHVNVLWSGGIDSTYIMTLMIELGILKKLKDENRLTIGLNQDSIKENPNFYDKYLKSTYIGELVQASNILNNPKDNEVIITGEMADNLVGSLTMKSCVDYYNDFSVVHKKYGTAVDWICRKLQDSEKSIIVEFVEEQISNSPVEIVTCHDLLWYLNFNLKWQAVYFRIVSHCNNDDNGNKLITNLRHFFNTDKFQQWSLHTGHHFDGTSWKDYKSVMKNEIYKVTRDREYFINKTKHPSLPNLLRYKDTYDFIYFDSKTNTYKFTKEMI